MSAAEKHDALARAFVHRAGRETASAEELLVVLESVVVGTMLLLTRLHDCRADVADGMIEAARARAFERFVEMETKR
jgi:hypothetical protein